MFEAVLKIVYVDGLLIDGAVAIGVEVCGLAVASFIVAVVSTFLAAIPESAVVGIDVAVIGVADLRY